jgi:predicted nucleic acid-binding protein
MIRIQSEVAPMTKYVITPSVVLRLAQMEIKIPSKHQFLAPTLLRSQLLTLLYQAVQRGEMSKEDADHYLNYVRGMRIRLLGDRVLQNVAWKIADKFGWVDTYDAEYIALTQLQADAIITFDSELASAVKDLVTFAAFEDIA